MLPANGRWDLIRRLKVNDCSVTYRVSHRPLPAETRFLSRGNTCQICCVQNGTWTGFPPNNFGFNEDSFCPMSFVPERQVGDALNNSEAMESNVLIKLN